MAVLGSSDAASSSSSSTLPDIQAFSVIARRSLTDILDRISGPKTLVLDPTLAGPLGLVAEMSLLREHGVDRIFWLEAGALTQAQKHIVYICRPEIGFMRIIADQIKAASPALNHSYTILLAPRVTSICATTLEDQGVLGSVDIHELPMSLIPLERDVLSMELGAQAYKDIYLDSNYDAIYEMARALLTLQRAFGLIPRIAGKGDGARRLVDIMYRLRKEAPSSPSLPLAAGHGQIDSLIVLDRQVDMVSPLCTQLTYEGLIDEVIGIKNCFVEVDAALTNPAPPTPSSSTATHFGATGPPRKRKHLLSTLTTGPNAGQPGQPGIGGDPLFPDLRDRNFTVIGALLNRTAKRINADYEGRHAAQTVGQMRDFVGRLSGLQAEHQALRLHTGLTEQIIGTTSLAEFNKALEIQQNIVAGLDLPAQENAIRELINEEANVLTVLRLLCMLSLASNGLKPKAVEDFKREILQAYGYEYLPLLISLSDLNLLFKAVPTKSAFAQVRKPLRLIVDDIDESSPEDIAYVYSGYAPLSVRLVQHALGLSNPATGFMGNLPGVSSGLRERPSARFVGWNGLEDVMRVLPGAVFEEVQKSDGQDKSRGSHDQPVTAVCFLGGCTYTEIAALRFTSQRMQKRHILILTTGIINGSTLMHSMGPQRNQ